jgi:hypothetical protein
LFSIPTASPSNYRKTSNGYKTFYSFEPVLDSNKNKNMSGWGRMFLTMPLATLVQEESSVKVNGRKKGLLKLLHGVEN